jgi:hypothetical protein
MQRFLLNLDAARSEPERPVCDGQSRHLGSRAGLDTYLCTNPSCGLRWTVHDPSTMTAPRKREAGPRQARPSVYRNPTSVTDNLGPRSGGLGHVQ